MHMCEDTQQCMFGIDSEYVQLAAGVFHLLSDPTRIRIILALRDNDELSVNRMADILGKSPTSVSQHLAKLRWAHMVEPRQDGTRVFYRLVDEHARHLVQEAVSRAEHAADDTPRHHRAAHNPHPSVVRIRSMGAVADATADPRPVRP